MLLLMDGSNEAEKLLDCSTQIFSSENDHFQGVFVEGIVGKNLDQVFEHSSNLTSQYTRSEIIEKILHNNLENSKEFIDRFVLKCDNLSFTTRVYLSGEDANENLVNESLYHDLFLISKEIFKKSDYDKNSLEAIEFLMKNAKCPMLMLSCEQQSFQNIVFIYDGSKRAFEAIKLFTYLMGEQMLINKVTLNIVVNENSAENEKAVIEYLKRYKANFYMHRVFTENYYTDLRSLLISLPSFLLVSGVNRNEFLEDLIFNRDHSFFMDQNRSLFLA